MEEVERRGLSGGIKLVRGLREELRELEFTLNETKSSEALCRAKIALIQSRIESNKLTGSDSSDARHLKGSTSMTKNALNGSSPSQNVSGIRSQTDQDPASSEKIATGNLSAIALK